MNKHSVALLALLVLIGVGLFAMIGYQRGRMAPPEGLATSAVSKGGLVINSVVLPGDDTPLAGTAPAPAAALPALPALPATDAAACP